jgi:hypothetical protein
MACLLIPLAGCDKLKPPLPPQTSASSPLQASSQPNLTDPPASAAAR